MLNGAVAKGIVLFAETSEVIFSSNLSYMYLLMCILNSWGLAGRTHSSGANALRSLNFKLILLKAQRCVELLQNNHIFCANLRSVYLYSSFLNYATYLS